MGKMKGELCPFCGQTFASGKVRGHHIRSVHRTALSAILADCNEAAINERRFVLEEEPLNAG